MTTVTFPQRQAFMMAGSFGVDIWTEDLSPAGMTGTSGSWSVGIPVGAGQTYMYVPAQPGSPQPGLAQPSPALPRIRRGKT